MDRNADLCAVCNVHRGFDLQAQITANDVVSNQYLNHLQVRKRAKQVEARVLCQSADNLRLAEETEPLIVPIHRSEAQIGWKLDRWNWLWRTHKPFSEPFAGHQIRSPV